MSEDRNNNITKEWLYKKYVEEKTSWADFYNIHGYSPTLIQNRLKRWGINRERIPWNKGTKGVIKANKTSFKKVIQSPKMLLAMLKGISKPNNTIII